MPLEGSQLLSMGFYTGRYGCGRNLEAVIASAKKTIQKELSQYGAAVDEETLDLEIDQVARLNLFKYVFRTKPNKGFTFYENE